MKIFSQSYVYHHDWDTVTTAFWLKYPNNEQPHVKRIDTVAREMDLVNKCFRIRRIMSLCYNIPFWARKVLSVGAAVGNGIIEVENIGLDSGKDSSGDVKGVSERREVNRIVLKQGLLELEDITCVKNEESISGYGVMGYGIEEAECDFQKKRLFLRSYNHTLSSVFKVEETCEYVPYSANNEWTQYNQTACYTVVGLGAFCCRALECFAAKTAEQKAAMGLLAMQKIITKLDSGKFTSNQQIQVDTIVSPKYLRLCDSSSGPLTTIFSNNLSRQDLYFPAIPSIFPNVTTSICQASCIQLTKSALMNMKYALTNVLPNNSRYLIPYHCSHLPFLTSIVASSSAFLSSFPCWQFNFSRLSFASFSPLFSPSLLCLLSSSSSNSPLFAPYYRLVK